MTDHDLEEACEALSESTLETMADELTRAEPSEGVNRLAAAVKAVLTKRLGDE